MDETGDTFSCAECMNFVQEAHRFCATCGEKIKWEEVTIKYYFKCGYQYDSILVFFQKFHDIQMSLRTLKSRLKSFGLKRRSIAYDEEAVRMRIQEELDGPACMSGYRRRPNELFFIPEIHRGIDCLEVVPLDKFHFAVSKLEEESHDDPYTYYFSYLRKINGMQNHMIVEKNLINTPYCYSNARQGSNNSSENHKF
eukprot:gene17165-18888_t